MLRQFIKRTIDSIQVLLQRSKRSLPIVLISVVLIGCDVDLYTNQKERAVNEMLSILLESNIDANKRPQGDGTFALRVDKSNRAVAISILESHGLPRHKHATMGELFPGDSIIASPLEERARFVFAIEQNLQETLSLIDGVLSARVHVAIPENNPLAQSLAPSSASVFIKTRSNIDLESQRSDIKRIVSKSIEGLHYRDVTLTIVVSTRPVLTHTSFPEPLRASSSFLVAGQGEATTLILGILCLLVGLASLINRFTNQDNDSDTDLESKT